MVTQVVQPLPASLRVGQAVEVVVLVAATVGSAQTVRQHGCGVYDPRDVAHGVVSVHDVLHRAVGTRGTKMAEPKNAVIHIAHPRSVAVRNSVLEFVFVIVNLLDIIGKHTVLVSNHALQHTALVVAIRDHLPVGVGHGLYPVPAVVFVLHLEGVGLVLKRKRKSTNIFGKFAEFAVTGNVSRRIRRFPQMAFGDVCRFYAHVGFNLLFEIRGSLYCLTAVFIFPNTATTIGMVTSGLPRSLNG